MRTDSDRNLSAKADPNPALDLRASFDFAFIALDYGHFLKLYLK